jgi:hypothetical protein
MKSKILIGLAPFSSYSLMGIYVIGGSQSLRRGRTAYHLGSTICYYYIFDELCQYIEVIRMCHTNPDDCNTSEAKEA